MKVQVYVYHALGRKQNTKKLYCDRARVARQRDPPDHNTAFLYSGTRSVHDTRVNALHECYYGCVHLRVGLHRHESRHETVAQEETNYC